jgi:hypothetical protein
VRSNHNLYSSNHNFFITQSTVIIPDLTLVGGANRLILRWENLGIFSQSQLRTYVVKSHNNTFRGVNWKMLRLSKVLLQFTVKGGDDCFDAIHGSVDKLS